MTSSIQSSSLSKSFIDLAESKHSKYNANKNKYSTKYNKTHLNIKGKGGNNIQNKESDKLKSKALRDQKILKNSIQIDSDELNNKFDR